MKWGKSRDKWPERWSLRKRDGFLWFPRYSDGEWRWLERATWQEVCIWSGVTNSYMWTMDKWLENTRDLTLSSFELALTKLKSNNPILCVSPELERNAAMIVGSFNVPTALTVKPSYGINMRVMDRWTGKRWDVLDANEQGEQCQDRQVL